MRRETQLAITGVAVVTVGIGGIVFLNQKQQIAQQEQAIDQQAIVARLLKERNAEDERFRQQQEAIGDAA